MKLTDIFSNLETKFGSKIAIKSHNEEHSYSDLKVQITSFGNQLNNIGITSKHTVGILMPHGITLSLTLLGTLSHAITCPLNPDLKEDDYDNIINRNHIDILICSDDLHHHAITAAKKNNLPILRVIKANNLLQIKFETISINPPKQHSHSKNLVIETSGTTSEPKLVGLTYENLITSAKNVATSLLLTKKDICLHFLPSYHIGGIVDVLLAPLLSGGSIVCMPTFSHDIFYRALINQKPTWTQAPPVMLDQIINKYDDYQNELLTHSLRLIRSVSAPLTVEKMGKIEKIFSIPVIEIYGMSEAAGVITSNPLPPLIRKPGSVGIPTNCELLVKSSEKLGANSPNEKGEIYIRGQNVIDGYINIHKNDSHKDGWLNTGDIGYLDDDGYLFLTGRSKDIINRGGEKISPNEIDQLTFQLRGVEDAAAFPISHKTLGEDIALAIVLNEQAKLTISTENVKEHIKSKLPYFKVPSKIIFVQAIPRNKNGKLQRSLLENYFIDIIKDNNQKIIKVANKLDPIEEYISNIWGGIFKTGSIGADDDFFENGGDSLLAASFINKIQEEWGTTIYVSAVFDAPTPSKFSQYLKQFYPDIINRILGAEISITETPPSSIDESSIDNLKTLLAKTIFTPKISSNKNKSLIFILSPPRSGSTLLRAMLAGHSKLFSPPELYLLGHDSLKKRDQYYSGSHRSQLEGNIRALMTLMECKSELAEEYFQGLLNKDLSTQEYYKILQDLAREKVLVDKTPAYAIDIQILNLAEKYFDNPKYIFLQRHPYGMIRSFEEARLEQLWFPRLVGKDHEQINSYPFNRRELAELIWIILNQNIIDFLSKISPDRKISIQYENLVKEPHKTMTSMCDWLQIPFENSMLEPQNKTSHRMVDGIHDISRMIGDPKFHQHIGITASAADQWKNFYTQDFLCLKAQKLAKELGYHENIANLNNRETFEF